MDEHPHTQHLCLARAAWKQPSVARLVAAAGSIRPEALTDPATCEAAGWSPGKIRTLLEQTGNRADEHWLEAHPEWQPVALGEPDYPPLLMQIPEPPPVLFVRGDPAVLHRPQVAMVGTRNPSADGRVNAHAFARGLADAGFVVTSGLALGVDGRAHEGALETGTTVAVLGTGPDRIYPARHKSLAERVAEAGTLVTEFPPGAPPRAHHFPRRNRIISGLSLATLVVEAAPRSGSLITARLAAEQGREVLAVPGSIHNPQSRGCHGLLRDGARWMESLVDVREALEPMRTLAEAVDPPGPEAPESEDDDPVLAAFTAGVNNLDQLHERTGLDPSTLGQRLAELELEGRIERLPGGYQCLALPGG